MSEISRQTPLNNKYTPTKMKDQKVKGEGEGR
jgi:hypothetical protein